MTNSQKTISGGRSIKPFEPFLAAVRTTLFERNGFFLLDLPVNATTRQLSRKQQLLNMMEKFGESGQNGERPPLASKVPTLPEMKEGLRRLREPELRLVDTQFWFWPLDFESKEADPGLTYIQANDREGARKLWREAVDSGDNHACSARQNLAVLALFEALAHSASIGNEAGAEVLRENTSLWKRAQELWHLRCGDEMLWLKQCDRVKSVNDVGVTTGVVHRIRRSSEGVVFKLVSSLAIQSAEQEKDNLARHYSALLQVLGSEVNQAMSHIHEAIAPIRKRVSNFVKAADESSEDPKKAPDAGRKLAGQVSPLLATLDLVLPESDQISVATHDEAANAVLRTSFTYSHVSGFLWSVCAELEEMALELARGQHTREKISSELQKSKEQMALSKCWYCGGGESNDSSSVEVAMYGNVWNDGLHIRWQHTKIKVRRCEECEAKHELVWHKYVWMFVLGVAGFVAGIVWGPYILLTSLFALSGYLLGLKQDIKSGKNQIRNHTDYNDYPIIRDQMKQGWLFGSGPATN